MVIVLLGQPHSGKSTLAEKLMVEFGTHHIDGDNFRSLFKNTDYSKQGRINNLKKACDIGYYLVKNEFTEVLIYSMVFPYKEVRDYLKQLIPDAKLFYLHYKEPRGREANHVSDFEFPSTEEAYYIDTDKYTIEESLLLIKIELWKNGVEKSM